MKQVNGSCFFLGFSETLGDLLKRCLQRSLGEVSETDVKWDNTNRAGETNFQSPFWLVVSYQYSQFNFHRLEKLGLSFPSVFIFSVPPHFLIFPTHFLDFSECFTHFSSALGKASLFVAPRKCRADLALEPIHSKHWRVVETADPQPFGSSSVKRPIPGISRISRILTYNGTFLWIL